ncbi:unnamed protein product [Rotaria sordida]|uniref:Uncharacterized protein n=1 Tax=Rotaria sordida TaxID=392033 RepID=A0A819JXL4_9BILA|nr:unnamed protein product [Rotaria sordida]CAF3939717.1 unnamed protein product [Rotaria sordida]
MRSIISHTPFLGFASSFKHKDAKRELANLFGLPLILLEYLFTMFEKIASKLISKITDIETLLQHFSNTYLYGNKFPPPRWNHFSSTGFTDRTNNALEGHHRSINSELDEQTLILVSQEAKQKRATKHQRKRYRDHDNHLIEAKELLTNKQIDLLEYQRRIRTLTYGYIKYHEENDDDSDVNNDV